MIDAMSPWPWVRLVWRYNLLTCPIILILLNWC